MPIGNCRPIPVPELAPDKPPNCQLKPPDYDAFAMLPTPNDIITAQAKPASRSRHRSAGGTSPGSGFGMPVGGTLKVRSDRKK